MRRTCRRDEGFAAVELVAGIALLLAPVAVVVLTLPTWSERQVAGRVIAREVARAVARSGSCDTGLAASLAGTMARNLGASSGIDVTVGCTAGDALLPGSDVEAAVTVTMPAVHLLGVGDVGTWQWTARHRQPVDLYTGVP